MPTLSELLLKKITARNAMSLSSTAVLLFAVVQIILDPAKYYAQIVEVAEGMEPVGALAVGGIAGMVLGAYLVIMKDVFQFHYRKAGPKPE